jgi:hypothetical protein
MISLFERLSQYQIGACHEYHIPQYRIIKMQSLGDENRGKYYYYETN